jgi:hypothetical protein
MGAGFVSPRICVHSDISGMPTLGLKPLVRKSEQDQCDVAELVGNAISFRRDNL